MSKLKIDLDVLSDDMPEYKDFRHVYINPYTNQPSQYDDTDPFRKH